MPVASALPSTHDVPVSGKGVGGGTGSRSNVTERPLQEVGKRILDRIDDVPSLSSSVPFGVGIGTERVPYDDHRVGVPYDMTIGTAR